MVCVGTGAAAAGPVQVRRCRRCGLAAQFPSCPVTPARHSCPLTPACHTPACSASTCCRLRTRLRALAATCLTPSSSPTSRRPTAPCARCARAGGAVWRLAGRPWALARLCAPVASRRRPCVWASTCRFAWAPQGDTFLVRGGMRTVEFKVRAVLLLRPLGTPGCGCPGAAGVSLEAARARAGAAPRGLTPPAGPPSSASHTTTTFLAPATTGGGDGPCRVLHRGPRHRDLLRGGAHPARGRGAAGRGAAGRWW